ALGDQFVEIFISRRAQWLQAEVIDDQQWYTGKRCQPSIVGAHSTRRVQTRYQVCAGREQDVLPLTNRTVPQGLCKMAFSGAARPDDEHRSAFADVTPGSQLVYQCPVQIG